MMLEPPAGGSADAPPVVEGLLEWECLEVERAFQVLAAAHLDHDEFLLVARALLARAMGARLFEPPLTIAHDADTLGAA